MLAAGLPTGYSRTECRASLHVAQGIRPHHAPGTLCSVLTLNEQAAAIASGDLSPVDLVDAALSAVDRVQPVLNAFTAVLDEDARERATAMAGADPLGPLHGVPVAVKDLYDVAGLPTTGSCETYRERLATTDSAVVQALREAGAIIVAKTNQHELACGTTTQISCFGPALNPWDTSRIPGGSSGGSGAAVAAGVVSMAMGSDTGGSIRIPSSYCGVTGLKPTHGSVSLRGAMPMTPSLDTGGPLAVSASDCILVHRVLCGLDPDDPYSRGDRPLDAPDGVAGLRVAVLNGWVDAATSETAEAVRTAARKLEELGCVMDEVDGPDIDGARDALIPLLFAEVAHHYRDLWKDDRVSPEIHFLIELGRQAPGADYVRGREHGLRLRRDFEWALTSADALLAPCTPHAAPSTKNADLGANATRFTLPVNAAGLPSLAFPVGMSSDGLPLGAQLIGRDFSEEVICALGAAFQSATDHHLKRPASLG